MKLPLDIGLPFVLRFLLSGVVLAAVLFPLASMAPMAFGYSINAEVLFVALAVFASLALLLLEHPIFELLAGQRYWPAPLRRIFVANEATRLNRLVKMADAAHDGARQTDLAIGASRFPLDTASGEPKALYPTRLGNLMASYETYPTVKYGLDGVFFWPRLWVAVDKDLREEIDRLEAVADGALYACFAFAVAAPIALLNAFATPHRLPWLVAAATSAILSVVFYRAAALPMYIQYGNYFAAVFDQHRSLLQFGTLVEQLDRHMADFRQPPLSERETSRAVWRFLRWHRYRRSGETSNIVVKDWLR